MSCCGVFVIVCLVFLPATVELISSGRTVKMTLDVFLDLIAVVMGKRSDS